MNNEITNARELISRMMKATEGDRLKAESRWPRLFKVINFMISSAVTRKPVYLIVDGQHHGSQIIGYTKPLQGSSQVKLTVRNLKTMTNSSVVLNPENLSYNNKNGWFTSNFPTLEELDKAETARRMIDARFMFNAEKTHMAALNGHIDAMAEVIDIVYPGWRNKI